MISFCFADIASNNGRSYFRLSPSCPPRFPLRAEPALALCRVDDRFVVISLTGHVIDALASHDADIAFDVAPSRGCSPGISLPTNSRKGMLLRLRYEITDSRNPAQQNRDQRALFQQRAFAPLSRLRSPLPHTRLPLRRMRLTRVGVQPAWALRAMTGRAVGRRFKSQGHLSRKSAVARRAQVYVSVRP